MFFSMHDDHVTITWSTFTMCNNHVTITWSTSAMRNDHVTITWSTFTMRNDHVTLCSSLFGFQHVAITWLIFTTCDGHMMLRSPHFKLSLLKSQKWLHFNLSSSDWNRPKNGHTSWLTVWININIGQPCCHDYTRLCMTVQSCVKAE